MNFLKNLLGRKDATSLELRATRDGIDLPAAAKALDDINAEHRTALLEKSDGEVTKIEQRRDQAKRDLDRARAAIEELDKRIAAAEATEALAAWRAERDRRNEAAETAARTIRDRYPALAREIAAMMEAAKSADKAVREWNNTRINNPPAGSAEADAGPIEQVETRLFNGFHVDGLNGSLVQSIRLPLVDPAFAPSLHDFDAAWRGQPLSLRGSR